MDKRAAIEIVKTFGKALEERGIRPLKIILYGSYANATHTARAVTSTLSLSPMPSMD
jgi:predicted nucleotidyltransferase